MADVFDVAHGTLFNDPNLQIVVSYMSPLGVVSDDVKMFKFVERYDQLFDQATARMQTVVFEVRVTDLLPEVGGRITVTKGVGVGDVFQIKSAVEKDASDRIWLLDVFKVKV